MGNADQMSPYVIEKINKSFSAQSMMATLGATLDRVDKGRVDIRAPLLDTTRQQHGFAHAGLTFSIGDSAAGYSALSLLPETHEVLTTEMKINLLAPAQGEALIARGRVIRPGRRLMVVQADIYALSDGKEKHIALMTGTMVPVEPK